LAGGSQPQLVGIGTATPTAWWLEKDLAAEEWEAAANPDTTTVRAKTRRRVFNLSYLDWSIAIHSVTKCIA
jgi:hypothetical protein